MLYGKYIIPVFLAGTLMFLIFVIFIVVYVLIHRRRGQENAIKLARLDLEHKNQLLITKLEEQEFAMTSISREIHDNCSQQIDLLMMYLKGVDEADNDAQRGNMLDLGKNILSRISNDLRNASYSLNGNYIKLHGLHEVLNKQLEYIESTKTMACKLWIEGLYRSLSPETELLVFRIAQEALHNAIKHSQAHNLQVILDYRTDMFRMEVVDDGIGFSMDSLLDRAPTLGLQNMRQRAEMLKGVLQVVAASDNGCRVTLLLNRDPASENVQGENL